MIFWYDEHFSLQAYMALIQVTVRDLSQWLLEFFYLCDPHLHQLIRSAYFDPLLFQALQYRNLSMNRDSFTLFLVQLPVPSNVFEPPIIQNCSPKWNRLNTVRLRCATSEETGRCNATKPGEGSTLISRAWLSAEKLFSFFLARIIVIYCYLCCLDRLRYIGSQGRPSEPRE